MQMRKVYAQVLMARPTNTNQLFRSFLTFDTFYPALFTKCGGELSINNFYLKFLAMTHEELSDFCNFFLSRLVSWCFAWICFLLLWS